MEYAENAHRKLVPDLFRILENSLRQPLHARNSFEIKYFERGSSKKPLKLPWFFLSHPVPFYKQNCEKQEGPATSYYSFFGFQNKLSKISF